jgi:hypothetical protein
MSSAPGDERVMEEFSWQWWLTFVSGWLAYFGALVWFYRRTRER